MEKSFKKIIQIAIAAIALLAIVTTTVVFASEDGFIKSTFDNLIGTPTAGADDIVSQYIEDMDATPISSGAGLFDADNNLVCSWESLVNDYGLVLDEGECDNEETRAYVEGGKNLLAFIMYDFEFDEEGILHTTPKAQFADATKLIIPNSIATIGFEAFGECSSLTEVIIPNSVTNIEEGAFFGCSALTNITIPNSVTSIEESTFSHCTALTNITIPNSITQIGDWAFSGCENLSSIIIPNSVTSIGERAFIYCTSLTNVTIPNSVTHVEQFAFYVCESLDTITWNNKTYHLEPNGFDTVLKDDLISAGICDIVYCIWSRAIAQG